MKDFPQFPPLGDAGAGVVDMFSRRNAPDEGDLDRLIDYWETMRKSHPVPMRRDIDPRAIDRILPNTFILERIAPGLARFRVAGTHLSELMGMDVRGMPISAMIDPEDRDGFAKLLNTVFDTPARLRLDLRGKGSFGRPGLNGAMIILPLRSDLNEVSRAIGCLVKNGRSGRAPRRFGVRGQDIHPILSGASQRKAPAPAATAPHKPMQSPPDPVAKPKPKAQTGSHLRLVVSN